LSGVNRTITGRKTLAHVTNEAIFSQFSATLLTIQSIPAPTQPIGRMYAEFQGFVNKNMFLNHDVLEKSVPSRADQQGERFSPNRFDKNFGLDIFIGIFLLRIAQGRK
jgi:hypothetical protein